MKEISEYRPTELVEMLENFIPVVANVLLSEVSEDARGQTAKITFNEDANPLIPLMVNALGSRIPSKQFTVLMIELDDNAIPVDQVRRAEVQDLMNRNGQLARTFYAICADTEFHRWLATTQGVSFGIAERKQRVAIAKEWAKQKNIIPQILDTDQGALDHFNKVMRAPFQEWRQRRLK